MTLPDDRPVDFLIIGAAKCATTWLQQSLMQTPAIYMPGPELHFFSREYDRGVGWYRKQFEGCDTSGLIGEKSNSYLTVPEAAQRIRDFAPNARLVLQMRDPVQRAYSDYCMLFRRGEVTGRIEDYLDPARAANGRFLSDGRYAHHLDRFYDLFPADQVLLLAFEDVRANPTGNLEKVRAHLNLKDMLEPPVKKKVKDKNEAMVPLPLRKALAPVRFVLDPVRNTWPVRSLRNAVARQVEYPALTDDLAKRMGDFYADDIARIEKHDPGVSHAWAGAQNHQPERIN
ncbi:sulfotransferase [uncultured Ruegeria sp.]|uniref:sulfotransferase family protein n=1 Tax=uncultured Ruegeria sp. TaxID=259304 RepID=UPI002610703B|nr:sulfotransferase [uncultured Ruegeria sp.]